MKKIILLFFIFIFGIFSVTAQNIEGGVFEKNEKNQNNALIGANIFWSGTTKGTTSNAEGSFNLPKISETNLLVIQYIGYETDTISVTNQTYLEIILNSDKLLNEVEVLEDKNFNTEPIQSELITTKDLRKAACCNLSESFETNATVDVSISDAVTGTKQLRMLGLDGIYAQIMTENIPAVRGLASRTGLNFIPGTWIKSIDVNKGIGSVVQGYESITGQINVEYTKPEAGEKLLLNGYANRAGRLEANLNTRFKISEKWSTAVLLHGSHLGISNDFNNDGFLDVPKFSQFNVLNRWKYDGDNLKIQLGINALYEDRTGGQLDFKKSDNRTASSLYGTNTETKRIQGFAKIGFLPRKNPTQSLGLIISGVYHEAGSFWGLNDYQATQNNLFANLIYQNNLAIKHELKLGMSYVLDEYKEYYKEEILNAVQIFDRYRQENVVGFFAEHSFKPNKKIVLISGIRLDIHNLYGNIISPRLHFKYEITESTILRVAGGKGFRTPNPLIEYGNFLISSRNLILDQNIQPEIAWNYGLSLSQNFDLWGRKGTMVADYYRTDFENQLVLDLESSSHLLRLYNLNGKAFANSLQLSLDYEWFKNFHMKLAYKFYDVQTTLSNGKTIEMPFIARNRAFINLGYSKGKYKQDWEFDLTAEWVGTQRLPNSQNHPVEFQMPSRSPEYILLNAQITKNLKKWSFYIGGENLGNYMQEMPVLSSQNPFGQHFDAGMIYAPVMGTMIYSGFRFTLN